MTTYTVEIQASNEDGTIWQAVHPAENIETHGDETAIDIARRVAGTQMYSDGDRWRVMVWEGADADTHNRAAAASFRGSEL
jgi:hypothetical protein